MISIPTIDEQVSLCRMKLRLLALRKSSKKFTPRTMGCFITDDAFVIAVDQILKEPLTETELYFFNKNVLIVNKPLLTKN